MSKEQTRPVKSERTIVRFLAKVNRFLNGGISCGFNFTPDAKFDAPKGSRRLPRVLRRRKSEQLNLKVGQVDFFRNLVVFDKTKSGKTRVVEMNSEVRQILLPLCKGKRPDDYVWINPLTGKPYTDIKRSFGGACDDAKIEGLVWHDLRATYGTRLGEAGYNAYDIAKLMGHANISTSQRYVRNLPVGAGEAVLLKNQRRHNTVTSEQSGTLALVSSS